MTISRPTEQCEAKSSEEPKCKYPPGGDDPDISSTTVINRISNLSDPTLQASSQSPQNYLRIKKW